jgi:hypothetical protein
MWCEIGDEWADTGHGGGIEHEGEAVEEVVFGVVEGCELVEEGLHWVDRIG